VNYVVGRVESRSELPMYFPKQCVGRQGPGAAQNKAVAVMLSSEAWKGLQNNPNNENVEQDYPRHSMMITFWLFKTQRRWHNRRDRQR
jgi:hypothetical protein